MRGIAGIVRFDREAANSTEIQRMIDAMAVCPVDRIDVRCDGSAAVAHLLKCLVAEDRFEQQPLWNADHDILLVTDALLENRPELAAALGWPAGEAATKADSEFVLAAYCRWGSDCPKHLEGAFALAVWHRREQRLFCAVDHFGRRPLYYRHRCSELLLATTLRGLFALPRVSRALDEDSFAAHVAQLDPADPAATLYREIRRVPGGHALTVDAAGLRLARYWNPDPARAIQLPSDEDYLAAFRHELERAVRVALARGLGNVGVTLSGGLDSSAVTAVAGKILAEQGRRLQAFHFVPPDANRTDGRLRELDESRFVEALRRHAPHIDFHFVPAQSEPASPDDWDTFFEQDFVPFHGLPTLGDAGFSELTRRLDIGVQLNGLGGNYLVSLESFASGYLTHLFITGRWPDWLRETRGHGRVYGDSFGHLARKTVLGPLKRALRPPAVSLEAGPVSLLQPALRKRTNIDDRLRACIAEEAALPWDFNRTRHHVLTHVARQQIGVARSVIRRDLEPQLGAAPLFDRRFNEFCLALPPTQQIRRGWDRRLLRETMRGLLPDEVRLRVTRGFPQPAFRRHFLYIEDALRYQLDHLSSCDAVNEFLHFEALRTQMERGAENPFGTYARQLLAATGLGRFLFWHFRPRTDGSGPRQFDL